MSNNTIESERKSKLRHFFKNQRASFSTAEVTEKSHHISKNFIRYLAPKLLNDKTIAALYISSGNEVQTNIIANYILQKNIILGYPKVTSKQGAMQFVATTQTTSLIPNQLFPNLLEPQSSEVVIPNLIIAPLLAFDKNLNRLGMGGGFYDRSISQIKQTNPKLITIGLAYESQFYHKDLPTNSHDRKMDFIVTENGVIHMKNVVTY